MGNVSLLEVLNRAETGPMCKDKDWDINLIPKKVSEKLRAYGLEKTCDPSNPIPSDDGLADDFWKAGFDLAVDVGLLCLDTNRIIKFSEEELRGCLQSLPVEVRYGRGVDQAIIRNRRPEASRPPVCRYGPIGMDLDEDLFIPIIMSILQYRVVDLVEQGQVRTIHGQERRAGTPTDTLGSWRRQQLFRQAAEMAGRPGLWEEEPDHCNIISELKTNYKMMGRVALYYTLGYTDRLTNPTYSLGDSIIGGYAGGPEGTVLTRIASTILSRPVYLAKHSHNEIYDVRYLGSTGRDAIWANSISSQAVSRNSHILMGGTGTTPSAGTCTKMLLQEIAISAMKDAANGNSISLGMRSRAGRYPNYATGLEMKFAAEVCKSSAGMRREDANEIAKKLLLEYESKLKDPPAGKSFLECFNIKTLEPSAEWLRIYREVWKDLEDMGLRPLFPYK